MSQEDPGFLLVLKLWRVRQAKELLSAQLLTPLVLFYMIFPWGECENTGKFYPFGIYRSGGGGTWRGKMFGLRKIRMRREILALQDNR